MREPAPAPLRGSCEGFAVSRLTSLCYAAFCLLILAFSCPSVFADTKPEKHVLVLSSFSVREAFVQLEPLKTTVRARLHGPVNFDVEYLDSQRFGIAGYRSAVAETLRRSYSEKRFDVVVVSSYPALRFAIDFRDRLFPGVPIIFMAVAPSRLPDGVPWPGVTGVTTNVDVIGSLNLALHLHPDTQNVAMIASTAELDVYWLGVLRVEMRQRHSKLTLIEIPPGSPDLLLGRVSSLPPHTVIFFHLLPQASAQPSVGPYDILAAVAQRFPTYCFHPYCMGHGALGGSFTDQTVSGVKAGDIVARVLSGESPESIPVDRNSVTHPTVDWRELRHWNISESVLPPGTVVLYREPSVWERYEKYLVAGVILIFLQALLIVALLWQRSNKRNAEAVLRESEKRFRVMANTTPSLVWMSDKDGNIIYVNDSRLEFTGHDPKTGLEDTWTAFVYLDDLPSVLAQNAKALEKRERFSKEYRLRRRDGVYRWMLDVAAPRINGDGKFAGFIGSASDITDQKMAQEALEKLGGRLIEAQEQERTRIARELHDDICQRLSLLSLELQQTYQFSNEKDSGMKERMFEIQQRCSEVAGDVQALSHQLHSSKLDYLGLVAALRSFCREYSQQHKVNLEFEDENIPNPLPRDISLCLFRVAQEALSNAVKYSRARRVCVTLRGMANQIQLEISDAGVGFDLEEAKQRTGLGLLSMQERVHMVNGAFSIQSKHNYGTRIVATVPLPVEADMLATSAGVA